MKKIIIILAALIFPLLSMADNINESSDIWDVNFSRSEMDDTPQVVMRVESLETIEKHGNLIRPILIIRCAENSTDLFITYKKIFLNTESIQVEYRLDDNKSIKATWGISTDYKATFARKPINLIKSMFNKDRMLIRLTPYGDSPIVAKFNISGLKESIEPLRKACRW